MCFLCIVVHDYTVYFICLLVLLVTVLGTTISTLYDFTVYCLYETNLKYSFRFSCYLHVSCVQDKIMQYFRHLEINRKLFMIK